MQKGENVNMRHSYHLRLVILSVVLFICPDEVFATSNAGIVSSPSQVLLAQAMDGEEITSKKKKRRKKKRKKRKKRKNSAESRNMQSDMQAEMAQGSDEGYGDFSQPRPNNSEISATNGVVNTFFKGSGVSRSMFHGRFGFSQGEFGSDLANENITLTGLKLKTTGTVPEGKGSIKGLYFLDYIRVSQEQESSTTSVSNLKIGGGVLYSQAKFDVSARLKYGMLSSESDEEEDENEGTNDSSNSDDGETEDPTTLEIAVNARFSNYELGIFQTSLDTSTDEGANTGFSYSIFGSVFGEFYEGDQLGFYGKYQINDKFQVGLVLNNLDQGESELEDMLLIGFSAEALVESFRGEFFYRSGSTEDKNSTSEISVSLMSVYLGYYKKRLDLGIEIEQSSLEIKAELLGNEFNSEIEFATYALVAGYSI